MKLHSSRLGLALLLAALFVSCGEPPQRTVYRGGTDHMPLLDGRSLRYREIENGEELGYTLTIKFIGGRHWKIYTVQEEKTPYGGIEFESNGNVVRATTQISLTSLESRKLVSAFTQVWLIADAPEDTVWLDEQSGTETLIAGYEGVTVPAGRFADCLKTVTTPLPAIADSVEARYQRGDSDEDLYIQEREVVRWQTVRWFAPGVGLVKEQLGPPGDAKIVRELVEVIAEGTGKVDKALLKNEEDTNE